MQSMQKGKKINKTPHKVAEVISNVKYNLTRHRGFSSSINEIWSRVVSTHCAIGCLPPAACRPPTPSPIDSNDCGGGLPVHSRCRVCYVKGAHWDSFAIAFFLHHFTRVLSCVYYFSFDIIVIWERTTNLGFKCCSGQGRWLCCRRCRITRNVKTQLF